MFGLGLGTLEGLSVVVRPGVVFGSGRDGRVGRGVACFAVLLVVLLVVLLLLLLSCRCNFTLLAYELLFLLLSYLYYSYWI